MIFNGWQRLWVIAANVLATILIVVGALAFPSHSNTPHQPHYLDALPVELRGLLTEGGEQGASRYEVENGFVATFQAGATEQQIKATLTAYTGQVAADTNARRWRLVLLMLALYLAAMGGLYALGWALGWVRRGFRRAG